MVLWSLPQPQLPEQNPLQLVTVRDQPVDLPRVRELQLPKAGVLQQRHVWCTSALVLPSECTSAGLNSSSVQSAYDSVSQRRCCITAWGTCAEIHALVCEPDLLDEVQNRCSNGNVQILRTASPQVRRCYPSLTCNSGVSVGDGSKDELHDTIDDLV